MSGVHTSAETSMRGQLRPPGAGPWYWPAWGFPAEGASAGSERHCVPRASIRSLPPPRSDVLRGPGQTVSGSPDQPEVPPRWSTHSNANPPAPRLGGSFLKTLDLKLGETEALLLKGHLRVWLGGNMRVLGLLTHADCGKGRRENGGALGGYGGTPGFRRGAGGTEGAGDGGAPGGTEGRGEDGGAWGGRTDGRQAQGGRRGSGLVPRAPA